VMLLDGLAGGKVTVQNVFLSWLKSWDRQTSEALWEVTDMLVFEMSGLGQSAAGSSLYSFK